MFYQTIPSVVDNGRLSRENLCGEKKLYLLMWAFDFFLSLLSHNDNTVGTSSQ